MKKCYIRLGAVLFFALVAAPAYSQDAVDKARSAVEKAASAVSPQSGQRDGTLGFPSSIAPGVVVAVKLQTGNNEGTRLDVLTRVGHLSLGTKWTVDVFVERVAIDVPTAVFSPGTGRPLPRLTETGLTSAGFRLSYHLGWTFKDAREALSTAATCIRSGDDSCQRFKANIQALAQGGQDSTVKAFTAAQDEMNKGFTFALGARLLYRSEQISGSAPGVAAEATSQYGFASGKGTAFASESFVWLSDSTSEKDGIISETSSVTEWRTTAGISYRFNSTIADVQAAPTVGAYGAYTRNLWRNAFAAPGMDMDIAGYSVEGGLFGSGHFSGGFDGLIQIGIRRPYGSSKPDFILTVSPSIGSSL